MADRSILWATRSPICRIADRAAFSRRIVRTACWTVSVESFFSRIFLMLSARAMAFGFSSALLFFSAFAVTGGEGAGVFSSFADFVGAGGAGSAGFARSRGGGAKASPPTRSTTVTERNRGGGER